MDRASVWIRRIEWESMWPKTSDVGQAAKMPCGMNPDCQQAVSTPQLYTRRSPPVKRADAVALYLPISRRGGRSFTHQVKRPIRQRGVLRGRFTAQVKVDGSMDAARGELGE